MVKFYIYKLKIDAPKSEQSSATLIFINNNIITYVDNSKTFKERVLGFISLVAGASKPKRSLATRLEYRKKCK